MSVRLGRLRQGASYVVRVEADSSNDGMTFMFIGWQPAPGVEPKSFPMRIEKGQSGVHALNCPPSSRKLREDILGPDAQGGAYLKAEVGLRVPIGQTGWALATSLTLPILGNGAHRPFFATAIDYSFQQGS